MQLSIARMSTAPVYERCRSVEYAAGMDRGTISTVAEYGRQSQDRRQWETLTMPVQRATTATIAKAQSARLRACGDVVTLSPGQLVLLRAFLQRWDESAKLAPTKSPEPAAPPTSAPSTGEDVSTTAPLDKPAEAPVTQGAGGASTSMQCKGDRICRADSA